MVSGRPDWCVSRQRSWGVGIPAFYCNDCDEAILTKESVGAVVDIVKRESSDAWYARGVEEILPVDFKCPKCGASRDRLRKETDVLDVWFDSGSTNRAVLDMKEHWTDLTWPAGVYLEGGDQHRGWFNSSLMIGVATRGKAPYLNVVTNGWTLDENGEAMHKSKGNVVNPLEIVNQFGADVLRCWVASQDFMEDTRCGENLLKQVSDNYRRLRNTFRFILNNLHDFDPSTDAVSDAEMIELDQWAIAQLQNLNNLCLDHYEGYGFHRVFHAVHNFCTVELSSFYLDVIKDRLYASAANWKDRRSAQTALAKLAEGLALILAPILPHTCEEVWGYLKSADKAESVHLSHLWAQSEIDGGLLERWIPLLGSRELVKKAIEEGRQAGTVTNSLECRVNLMAEPALYEALSHFGDQLASLFVVSQVTLLSGSEGLTVTVDKADGEKCGRCWLIRSDVGTREEHPTLCGRCTDAISG